MACVVTPLWRAEIPPYPRVCLRYINNEGHKGKKTPAPPAARRIPAFPPRYPQEGSFMPVLPRLFAALLVALPLGAGAGLSGALAQEEGADEVIATVNGTPIRYSDIAMADEEMGGALARFEPEVQFQYLLGMLIDRRVVALEAKAKHVDDDPAVKRRQDYFNEKALRDVYWVQLMQDKVSEEAIRAYYKKNVADAPAEKEAHARHILVETKAQAEKIAGE